jgi:hypothetical protein
VSNAILKPHTTLNTKTNAQQKRQVLRINPKQFVIALCRLPVTNDEALILVSSENQCILWSCYRCFDIPTPVDKALLANSAW